MSRVVWGNENPDGPAEHRAECKCINCEVHHCACGNEVEKGEEFCEECK